MSVAGGLLTLDAFNRQFPQMDTINTTGATKSYNSTIQGRSKSPSTKKKKPYFYSDHL